MVNLAVKNNQPTCQISKYGTKRWILNGKLHREDGPAIEYVNGPKYWWYHGERILCSSQEEFERLLKLKALW